MTSNACFSISTKGSVQPGFESDNVVEAFSSMFGVPAEKAEEFVCSEKLIKKNLTREQVDVYKAKLTEIGLDVVVDGVDEDAALFSLVDEAPANEPDHEPAEQSTTAVTADSEIKKPALTGDQMQCPKCDLQQAKADECSGCGIIVAKFNSKPVDANSDQAKRKLRERQAAAANDDDEFNLAALILAAVAAMLGAALWNMIASMFGYELGIVAWAIGGAIGFAASLAGGRGNAIGVCCAVLALLAIMGGKYFVYAGFQDELNELFSAEGGLSEIEESFSELERDIKGFAAIDKDNRSIRQYMVDYGYSEESSAIDVTDSELQDFKTYSQPYLEEGVNDIGAFEDGFTEELQGYAESMEISTFGLMFSSLGLLDLLFLFLGVSTAFQLGREGRD